MASIAGKALVTGASGFIGRRLVGDLLDASVDVIALRRKGSPEPKRGRSAIVEYDDRAALADIIGREKPDYVFHVAGATKGVTYDDFRQANVMPTVNLLSAIEAAHPAIKRFVHVSSLTSYGPSAIGRHHTESSPRKPIEFYGQSKLEAEQAVEAMGDKIAWTILRPGGVYGPGDVDYLELFKSVEKGLNLFFGNKDRWFSAIYVDDLVQAIEAAATHESTRGKGYFVSDGTPLTWATFQKHIVEASGRRPLTVNLPEAFVGLAAIGGEFLTKLDKKPRLFNKQKAKMGAEDSWTCESNAFTTDATFSAKVPVSEGVRKTLSWYRTEHWL